LFGSILPVLDTLNAAMEQIGKGDNSETKAGIELFAFQFLDCLDKSGLKEERPVGAVFSPDQHDCVRTIPGNENNKGTISKIYSAGYSYKGIIIRYPKVEVYE